MRCNHKSSSALFLSVHTWSLPSIYRMSKLNMYKILNLASSLAFPMTHYSRLLKSGIHFLSCIALNAAHFRLAVFFTGCCSCTKVFYRKAFGVWRKAFALGWTLRDGCNQRSHTGCTLCSPPPSFMKQSRKRRTKSIVQLLTGTCPPFLKDSTGRSYCCQLRPGRLTRFKFPYITNFVVIKTTEARWQWSAATAYRKGELIA